MYVDYFIIGVTERMGDGGRVTYEESITNEKRL